MEMHFQFRKPKRIVQFLAIALSIYPCMGHSQLLDELFNTGVSAIQAVDSVLLDMSSVSDTEENQIGTELKKEILQTAKISAVSKNDPAGVLKKLMPYCRRKDIKYDISIIKNEVFNAYTVAGGKIFIHTGLLDNLQNEDELAFVIAHELAHNELKHCIHRIQHSYQASKLQPALGTIVQLAYGVYKHPFSKEEERQADEYAVRLMQKAGYKKVGAISFFVSLEKQESKWKGSNLQTINDFVSTHPTAVERRQRVEKL